jgi:hypothetical protein
MTMTLLYGVVKPGIAGLMGVLMAQGTASANCKYLP